jgi:hypothetical protein
MAKLMFDKVLTDRPDEVPVLFNRENPPREVRSVTPPDHVFELCQFLILTSLFLCDPGGLP